MEIKQIERISKALGDPYRLKILEAIKVEKTWLPCSSILGLCKLSQSTISHHLKQLTDADLVLVEKEGRATSYMINKTVFDEYIAYLTLLK